jgi:hypothetical protein
METFADLYSLYEYVVARVALVCLYESSVYSEWRIENDLSAIEDSSFNDLDGLFSR